MPIVGFQVAYNVKNEVEIFRGRDSQIIDSSILQILSTRKGERVMLNEFGCSIKDMLFDPLDDTLKSMIVREAWEALARWEDRITVQNIEVVESDQNIHQIIVRVSYVLKGGIQVVQEMEVPFLVGSPT